MGWRADRDPSRRYVCITRRRQSLHAVGLPELIAANEEDYFALAAGLAAEPDRLAALKAKLKRERLTAPLFDVAAYTGALENLYETMWSRRIDGACTAIWAANK